MHFTAQHSHGNQFLQLDLELKPSPLGDRFPPRRGKMSRSDKRGNRWRVAPDEGYLGQNAAVLRPHQSPAVTASPGRGKPSCGKLISVRHSRAARQALQRKEDRSRPLAQGLCGGIPHVQDFLRPSAQTAVLSAAGFYDLCTESSCGSGCRPAKRPERDS